jgi:hypothetical protein
MSRIRSHHADMEFVEIPGTSMRLLRIALGTWAIGAWMGRGSNEDDAIRANLRKDDPKFLSPRFEQYLAAVERLDRLARERYGRPVIQFAARWVLDRGERNIALWGARRADQLSPIADVVGWHIDSSAMAEIDRILQETIREPIGRKFMAPPDRLAA